MQNYSSFSDLELTTYLKIGDRFAFDEIYYRYWQILHEKASRILHHEEGASDIIQDVFISLWQRKEKVEVHNLKSYLHQAVKFAVFKAIRDNKVSENFYARLAKITTDLVCEDPVVFKETQHYIQHLLDELPEDCRTIFNMSRLDNLTYKKIAAQLGISEKTVEKKITISLKHIRKGLSLDLCIIIFVNHMLR